MLSTSNVSAKQAENYYTHEDVCAAEPEQTRARLGQGAITLGLARKIEPDVFRSLLHGFAPEDQALFGRSVGSSKRRAATDYTFSAPKSVSMAALVQGDERVLQAHQRAIAQTLSILEERYLRSCTSLRSLIYCYLLSLKALISRCKKPFFRLIENGARSELCPDSHLDSNRTAIHSDWQSDCCCFHSRDES
jgi:hypothetical protein